MHKKLVKKIDAGARELDSMREITKVCDIKVNSKYYVCLCQMGSNCLQTFVLYVNLRRFLETKMVGICQSWLWKGADEDEDEEAASTHDCAWFVILLHVCSIDLCTLSHINWLGMWGPCFCDLTFLSVLTNIECHEILAISIALQYPSQPHGLVWRDANVVWHDTIWQGPETQPFGSYDASWNPAIYSAFDGQEITQDESIANQWGHGLCQLFEIVGFLHCMIFANAALHVALLCRRFEVFNCPDLKRWVYRSTNSLMWSGDGSHPGLSPFRLVHIQCMVT